MKKTLALMSAMALMFTMTMAPLALADDEKKGEMVEKTMTAEIQSVDVENNQLMVKRIDSEINEALASEEFEPESEHDVRVGDEVTLSVPEETDIYREGRRMIPLAALNEGERVNVTYRAHERDDGGWIYYLILVER